MQDSTKAYWMEVPPIVGQKSKPTEGGILIIGSGLSGASAAYWLQQAGFEDLKMVDFEIEKSATFRNCGHILYGTVESMQALAALHGKETAKEIWSYSIEICHEVRETVKRLNLDADYAQSGYLVVAIDESENAEIKESIELLTSMGFESNYVPQNTLHEYGFRHVTGGRYEAGSAQAHPVKFRNGVLKKAIL